MGFRLDIYKVWENEDNHYNKEVSNVYYGTKLYGYIEDERKLLSYMYLKSLGKVDGDEYFGYGITLSIPMTKTELTIFLNLYSIDLDNNKTIYTKDYEKGWFLKDEQIKPLLIDSMDNDDREETYLIEWC